MTTAKQVGKKEVDVGKAVALDTGKKLIEKGVNCVLTPKSRAIVQKLTGVSPDAVAKKAHNISNKYTDVGA